MKFLVNLINKFIIQVHKSLSMTDYQSNKKPFGVGY